MFLFMSPQMWGNSFDLQGKSFVSVTEYYPKFSQKLFKKLKSFMDFSKKVLNNLNEINLLEFITYSAILPLEISVFSKFWDKL